jgi:hypothetical protein
MGLCNAPATFMHLMNSLLREGLDKFVLAFLDDIFIYSQTEEEHLRHIEQVLLKLREHKLYLKPSKCEWMKSEVEFLGHRIGREGLSVDPQKVDAVKQWPAPSNVSDLRSFLGLAGYYRRFLENYSKKALPLTELTKDEVEWHWGTKEQEAFDMLKEELCTAPVLQLANPKLPYVIHCDASGFAVGGCLMQDQGQGLQPVSYISAKMKPAETRYAPHEQELLALVYACKRWRHYLHNNKPFTVFTDHQSLKYFPTQPILSARQARWKDHLAEFDFVIKYIEGPKNVVADSFSRRPDHQQAAVLEGHTVGKQEFLASIVFKDIKEEVLADKPCAGRQTPCELCALQVLGARRRRAAAPILDPAAREAERLRNKKFAEEVLAPSPDLPAPNRHGAIVMPTQVCTALKKGGKQCAARTTVGQYCFAHRRLLHHTHIKKAAHGKGLFATADFKRGQYVADYTGELVTGGDDVGGAYFVTLRKRRNADGTTDSIDAARTNAGDGRWANDPRGSRKRANCEFATTPGTNVVRLRVTSHRGVKAGEEFLLSYGRAYWKSITAGQAAPEVDPEVAQAPAPPAVLHWARKVPPAPARRSTRLQEVAELSAVTMRFGDFGLVAEAREAAQKDEEYQKWLTTPPTTMTARDGLLWMGGRLVVPADSTLRTKLMAELHDTPTGGHFGRDKTLAALSRRFWWKHMTTEAKAYVAGCDMCQRTKHSQQKTPGLLMPLPVPDAIDSHWNVDFVTGLPKTQRGHDSIQGHFSRGGSLKRLAPTSTSAGAVQAAETLVAHVVRHHGIPASIVSDRDPKFVSKVWRALMKRLGTKGEMSTGYHAQTDGHAEREQKTLTTWLRAFATEFPKDWDQLLPLAELALNCMPQAASGVAPYELLYGRNPAQSVDRALSPSTAQEAADLADVPAAEERWKQMAAAWEKVRGKLLAAQRRMVVNADRHRRDQKYKAGDMVLLSTEHLRLADPQFNRKLAHLYCGPFPVKSVVNNNAYELELPDHMHIHATVNISHLRPYRDGSKEFPSRPAAPGLQRPPPAALDPNGQPRYEVERILAQKGQGAGARYLVLWKGYPYSEATWEDAFDVNEAVDALKEWKESRKRDAAGSANAGSSAAAGGRGRRKRG